MDELIHELRSYAHKYTWGGTEIYDQYLIYLADQIEEKHAETESDVVLVERKVEMLAGIMAELCKLLGIEVGTKTDAQIANELMERCRQIHRREKLAGEVE